MTPISSGTGTRDGHGIASNLEVPLKRRWKNRPKGRQPVSSRNKIWPRKRPRKDRSKAARTRVIYSRFKQSGIAMRDGNGSRGSLGKRQHRTGSTDGRQPGSALGTTLGGTG
ncbi:uncharacterized protein LOC119770502 [Culex quinquefasciatus]|uniref:uncharacterized protein LOC119770502 n=1 Tax=Culex quinquefasciatus TaxID=7176 RepID=UPI0018E2FF17|nr:uncharacterized protein LOC119770502 [Culex quinquefasciatus]